MGQSNRKCTSTTRLDGVTAVITGSNTGIGKATAEDFYIRGAKVVLCCRDTQKARSSIDDITKRCEELRVSTPSIGAFGQLLRKTLDLNCLASVRACAEDILKTEQRVQLLINNAAVMLCPKGKTEDGFERHFGVNHLGHFLFTMLLLPTIIESEPSRIVNVASLGHAHGQIDFDDIHYERRDYIPTSAYQQSKLANVLFTRELAKRLQNIPRVNVYALHPGMTATELSRHANNSAFPCLRGVSDAIARLLLQSPLQGAQTSIHCAVDDKCAEESGLYYSNCEVVQPDPRALDEKTATRLWEESLKMVGITQDPFPLTE